MEASARELDTLAEIANVGMSRAAAQLSMLLNDQIEVSVPQVSIVDMDRIAEILELDGKDDIASVSQQLDGYIHGTVLLLFHTDESRALVNALVGNVPILTGTDMRSYEHEAMTEIGNIMISSGIAAMADLMQGEVRLSAPVYVEVTVRELINRHVNPARDPDMMIIVMKAELQAAHRDVTGSLIVLLGVRSVNELISRINTFHKERGHLTGSMGKACDEQVV